MSIASSVARSVATPVARAVAGLGGGGSVWTPESLSTLRQWLADNYYSSPVGGLQVIESLETHGTVRPPQPGCCALFDGTNDYGTLGARLTPVSSPTLTVSCRIIPTGVTGSQAICSEYGPNGFSFLLAKANAKVRLVVYADNGGVAALDYSTTSDVLVAGQETHITAVFNAGVITIYIDGVSVALTDASNGSPTTMNSTTGAHFEVGCLSSGIWHYDGKLADLRVYSTAKTAPEAAAISACDFTNLDTTGIVAGWYLNDRAGTTARDWSGNGHDLTLSGPITESTFWAEDSAITANPANVLGYTLSGSTIIPRDESDPTKDVQGNALGNTGLSPYPATIETPCITLDGVNDYATSGLTLQQTGAYTLCAWIKPTVVTTTKCVISNLDVSGSFCDYNLEIGRTSGKVSALANGGAVAITSTGSITAGAWTHIAVTKSGSVGNWTFKVYINGVLDKTVGGVAGNANGTTGHCVVGQAGSYPTTFFFQGSITDPRIYSVAKSDAEVLAICNGAVDTTSAVGIWPMQEGAGTASDNVTCYDISGNSRELTLTNTTVATAWGTRCPGYVKDHAFEYGGRLGTLGEFVPLVPGTSLCADGEAPTLLPGSINNPYSRVDFDPFDAAELGALNVPDEFDSLPCVTGNGTDLVINIGGPLLPATADFELVFDYYHETSTGILTIFEQAAFQLLTNAGVPNKLQMYDGGAANVFTGDLVLDAWNRITVRSVSGQLSYTVGSHTTTPSAYASIGQSNARFLNGLVYSASDGRIANISVTAGGVTKYFPLTDGSGADIAMYENGVATVISNAIQGALTNVWANKTEGNVDHSFPEATRAIVPRDTKFTNGTNKTLTTSTPATGADLTNILGYIG